MKLLTFIVALFLCGSSEDYVSSLRSSVGESYSDVTCSRLITKARRHAPCSARQFWDGCGGDLVVVQEVTSLSAVNKGTLHAGDVLDFGGIHVAAYLGAGEFIDSVPERGCAKIDAVNPHDPWYTGKVRILRWRNS